MSIELHIERLVIDEALLGGEGATDVRAALERELARRLATPGAAAALRGLGALESLPLQPLVHARHPRERLGERIAEAVGGGLDIAAGSRSPRACGAGCVPGDR